MEDDEEEDAEVEEYDDESEGSSTVAGMDLSPCNKLKFSKVLNVR